MRDIGPCSRLQEKKGIGSSANPRSRRDIAVPDHDGGRPKEINAWFLYTHMVYL